MNLRLEELRLRKLELQAQVNKIQENASFRSHAYELVLPQLEKAIFTLSIKAEQE